jgi:hypothetical protein
MDNKKMLVIAVGIIVAAGVIYFIMKKDTTKSDSDSDIEEYVKAVRRSYSTPQTTRVSSSRPLGIQDARSYGDAYANNNYVLA